MTQVEPVLSITCGNYARENNEQSSQLRQLGAEIAVGDLLDFMTIRPFTNEELVGLIYKART